MKRIVTFCALCALLGCHQVAEPSGEVIALSYSTSEQSKTDVLTLGDQISVFACMEGTEDYFLDNAKYVVGSDGRSLSTSSAVYYPDPKQAVRFFACFPYHTGTFSVPTDQSTALALKQADLCWASACSTPVASAVPLEFTHQLARLLITTNTPTTKIVAPNLFSGGTLNVRTGVFTNTLKSDISTTGTELILPVQPLSRLVLTVAGVEYVFEGAIALQAGQTTTLNLTLHPATHTATLSGSSTTNWTSSTATGNPTQAVSNILTLHWPSYVPQGATPDKVAFTIGGTDYTVASGITYADKTFTVPFASAALRYPYTISKIAFYRGASIVFPTCTQLLGAAIYKSSEVTVGIKDPANAVKIGDLWWAVGNLIADGPNGCKIGAPTDCGLYFQFGSLVGWKGGANGDGTGYPTTWTTPVVIVVPQECTPPTEYPIGTAPTDRVAGYYFAYNTPPYSNDGQPFSAYPGVLTGGFTREGIGDPCRYYLGGSWRLPNTVEIASLVGSPYRVSLPFEKLSYQHQPTPHVLYQDGVNQLRIVVSGVLGGTIFHPRQYMQINEWGYFYNSDIRSGTYVWTICIQTTYADPKWSDPSWTRDMAPPIRCVSK